MAILIEGFAVDRPNALALADDTDQRTFAELDERVNRTIHALRAAGLGHGDTIAMVSGNRIEWFEMALACASTGITHVPVNWHLVANEIAYIVADSGSKAVLAGHRFADEVRKALDDDRCAGVELALGGVLIDADAGGEGEAELHDGRISRSRSAQ